MRCAGAPIWDNAIAMSTMAKSDAEYADTHEREIRVRRVAAASLVGTTTLRLVQDTALGGEWGGAVLMAYEFARPQERAYYACFQQIGLAVGLCCSTGVVSLLSFVLSERDFDAWCWRVAFMLSIALLASGCSYACAC
jgi:MFS family permease